MAEIFKYTNSQKEETDKRLQDLEIKRHKINEELNALTKQYKILRQNGKALTAEQIDHYFRLHGEFENACSESTRILIESGRVPADDPYNLKAGRMAANEISIVK